MRNLLIIALIGLVGCELVVDVDVPIEKRKITLNAQFTPDSLWKAHVSLSRHILDDFPFKSPDDASVFILQDGSPIDTLVNLGQGFYESDSHRPFIGMEYEIKVESDKYENILSRSSSPAAVSLAEVNFSVPSNPTGKEVATISIRFQDPPEANYYEVVLMVERKYFDRNTMDTLRYKFPVTLESTDPMFADTNVRSDNSVMFNDVLFDGKEKTFEFTTDANFLNWYEGVKLLLHFKTLSRDLYLYKITSELQQQVSDDPFAQPVKVYNNVQNGFGIFGGYSEHVYKK